jgi:hypothetical protein
MKPDHCPIGGEPCQSLCVEPCSTTRRHVTYVCPVCAASMVEADEALLRQALAYILSDGDFLAPDAVESTRQLIAAIRVRLEGKA